MQGMMMHCGAEPITLDQVAQLLPPPPTETHFPIPHRAIYDTANEKIHDAGYEVIHAQHYTNREHAHYFALLELDHEQQEHSTMLALRNSYDKVFRASLAIGARVFVCDNLSFSGDIVVGHKNTVNGFGKLPERFEEAVTRIKFMQKRQELRFDEYKQAPLDDKTADHLTMECYRRGIVNLQRIGAVNREWYEPAVDHGGRTVWRFFNATTAALKAKSASQLIQLPKRTIDLHLLLDEFCDVELPEEEPALIEATAEAPTRWRDRLSRLVN
jgi:hypothetical protein